MFPKRSCTPLEKQSRDTLSATVSLAPVSLRSTTPRGRPFGLPSLSETRLPYRTGASFRTSVSTALSALAMEADKRSSANSSYSIAMLVVSVSPI